MPRRVAIIGSGPAGFYAAAAALNKLPEASVDIIERLPSPFGLIRAGVAPDHQSTKQVVRKFEKTAADPRVSLIANVDVGTDVSVAELQEMYDAVVIAIGSAVDRKLDIPGADLPGVYGAQAFVSWYNAHPDYADLHPNLNVGQAAVIGNGNVALDVARLLARSESGRARTDMPDHVKAAMNVSPITDVHVLGRRGPAEAKFTNVELREMLDLSEGIPVVDPADLPDDVPASLSGRDQRLAQRNLDTFRQYLSLDAAGAKRHVHFDFFRSPVAILGTDKVEGIRVERTQVDEDGRAQGTGETIDIPCGLVVTAIGYQGKALDGVPFDAERGIIPNENARVAPGLYAVGWIMRGPSGVISSSKPDGIAAAERIAEDVPQETGRPGGDALRDLMQKRGIPVVDFAAWRMLDAAEVAGASHPAPRLKFYRSEDMLNYLKENKQ
jgi:NADPH-dependent glutamate synthase beta subunit-like oxidoreductase